MASAVSLLRMRWFGTVCCEHVTLGKHGSSSLNNSEPNQRRSDTVLLHGGHNSVFLSSCHVVCALCLCGTASCLGFQTLDLMFLYCWMGAIFVWNYKDFSWFLTVSLSFFPLWYLTWCCLLNAACISKNSFIKKIQCLIFSYPTTLLKLKVFTTFEWNKLWTAACWLIESKVKLTEV